MKLSFRWFPAVTAAFIFCAAYSQQNLSLANEEASPLETELRKSIFLIKNEDALVEDRKRALMFVMNELNEEARSAILETVGKRNETQAGKTFHVYLKKTISESKDKDMMRLVEEEILNAGAKNYAREIALSVLWQMDREKCVAIAERLVQSHTENKTVRSAAMNHLMAQGNSEKILELAWTIFRNRREETNIRQTALKYLQDNTVDPEKLVQLFATILADTTEQPLIRSGIIFKMELFNIPDAQNILLGILKNNKEDLLVRRAALQGLIRLDPTSQATLLEIEKLSRINKNSEFQSDLSSAIEQLRATK